MELLKKIEKMSIKSIIQAALLVGIIVSFPVGVKLSQTQTETISHAQFKPSPQAKLIRGVSPSSAPVIESVSPFLGKEDDIIIVKGTTFGFYPEKAFVRIGNVMVSQDRITEWTDTKISFFIPPQATSGEVLISNGSFTTVWDKILTVYSPATKTQVSRSGNSLFVKNVTGLAKAKISFFNTPEVGLSFEKPKNATGQAELIAGNLSLDITWITLFDSNDRSIPFFVNPPEFGF